MESFGMGSREVPVASGPEDQGRGLNRAIEFGEARQGPLVAGAHLGDEGPDFGAPEGVPEVGAELGREAAASGEEGPPGPTEDRPGEPAREHGVPAEPPQDANFPG